MIRGALPESGRWAQAQPVNSVPTGIHNHSDAVPNIIVGVPLVGARYR